MVMGFILFVGLVTYLKAHQMQQYTQKCLPCKEQKSGGGLTPAQAMIFRNLTTTHPYRRSK